MKIDQIIRSHRTTIALIIRHDGKLIVRAPYRTPDAQILQFIEEKAGWIREKQAEAQERLAQRVSRQFVSGERFLYLGEAHPLEITSRARPSLALENGRFLLSQNALPRAKDIFTAWYKQQARQVFEERARSYAARYHLTSDRSKITSARTRWGSCSARGTLSFTWRLVMAPLPVIDYVVIHELAHLVEKNHSKRFWEKVRAMMGEYKKYVGWLKTNGQQLNLE